MGGMYTDSSSVPVRWGVIGAASAGVIGAVAGLVIGLAANPPTAWFAVFELGVPSAILGGLVGLVCGAVVLAARRFAARER